MTAWNGRADGPPLWVFDVHCLLALRHCIVANLLA